MVVGGLQLLMDKYVKEVNGREEEDIRTKLKWYSDNYGPYIQHRGFNNWKNLFKKPSMYEWTILFMLLMGLFMAWAYNHDIASCREHLNQEQQDWLQNQAVVKDLVVNPLNISLSDNLSPITIKEVIKKEDAR